MTASADSLARVLLDVADGSLDVSHRLPRLAFRLLAAIAGDFALGQAWADPALFREEVRNYIRRLRKILEELAIPVDLVNKPGRGDSLVFRPT